MLKSALIAKLKKEKKGSPAKQRPAQVAITLKDKRKKPKKKKVEVLNYDEEISELGQEFHVPPANLEKGVNALLQLSIERQKSKNQLFEDEPFPIFLQVNSIKSPHNYSRIIRLPLRHSLLKKDSEICLIVLDVKGVPNKEHDKHLEQYEKLLVDRGVKNVKKIMTFHEFRTEYETFELKRRLVELYDVFLVDGRISGKVTRKCGKIFYQKRKIPTAIKLQATKLKDHIDQTLTKTSLYFHSKGDSFVVEVGHSKMEIRQLVENILYIIKGLEKEFPGGFNNIRNLNIFGERGTSIPIYTSLRKKDGVDLKKNVKKRKLNETVSGELTTKMNTEVTVKADGKVKSAKIKN